MNDNLDMNKIYSEAIVKLVEKNIEKIFSTVKKNFKDALKKSQIDFSTAFECYLNKGSEKHSNIKTLLYSEPKFIYDFYVCNYLKRNSNHDIYLDANSVNNILEISKFILISGSGGLGKTMMLKHFFLNCIKTTDLIPIFIELRGQNNTGLSLNNYIYQRLNILGFTLEQEYFEYALKSGRFLILFDGLDEIENKYNILNEINIFCDKYADNHFIITSRPSNSDVNFTSLQRFTTLQILPLEKQQSLSLISRIHFDESVKKRFLSELNNFLFKKHETFASNPLLLTIMLLTYESYANIPEKLHTFYSYAFETLLIKHDATKDGYRRKLKSRVSVDDFRSIISELCFKLFIKQNISFTESMVIDMMLE